MFEKPKTTVKKTKAAINTQINRYFSDKGVKNISNMGNA